MSEESSNRESNKGDLNSKTETTEPVDISKSGQPYTRYKIITNCNEM